MDAQYNIKYYYCKNCYFIFLDEEKIISPKKEKERYMKHNNDFSNEGYVIMFKRFIKRWIRPYYIPFGTALDFGCGPVPVLALLLKEEGFEVDIYDLHFAPEKVYTNKKYDLITLTEVIEHLKNPLKIINTLIRHLNRNGILVIMTLFHPENEEVFKKWWYRTDCTHISFYSAKTFRYIANTLDLKVLITDEKNICVLCKNKYENRSNSLFLYD